MRRSVIGVVAAMLVLRLAGNAQAQVAAGTAGSSTRSSVIKPLDASSADVVATYNKLHAPQSRAERFAIYAPLSSAMKAAVWVHQFETALSEHPEYTQEQRDVLQDAIGLFTPELFAIPSTTPEWSSKVDLPVQEFTRRAKAAFGVVVAGKLFAELGPTLRPPQVPSGATPNAAPGIPPQSTAPPQTRLHAAVNDTPPCDCSTISDYCSWELTSDYKCVQGGCYFGMNWGCGTGELYRCDGLCLEQFT